MPTEKHPVLDRVWGCGGDEMRLCQVSHYFGLPDRILAFNSCRVGVVCRVGDLNVSGGVEECGLV